MSNQEFPKLTDSATYREIAKRAKADKPPTRSSPLGTVAKTRVPGVTSRKEMQRRINEQDDLVVGHFGTVYYKPVTVCGVDLKLEPLQPSIGTVIHGIDLATDLQDPEMVKFLRDLWLERRVIMFRDQGHLTREQMVEFANRFGEIGATHGERDHIPNSPTAVSSQVVVPGIPDMLLLISDEDVPQVAGSWHCDATWQPRPPMGSVLMCREAPVIGGDTCFCDCYSMWEGLREETRRRVEHLTAIHIGGPIHQMDGVTPQATHPVARTHPETGRTTLYVQQGFVRQFAEAHGVPADEEKVLLREMKLLEGRPENTCRFKWEAGSIAMWDNRAVLHSGSGDYWPHRRMMERLTILDFDESRRAPYYSPQ